MFFFLSKILWGICVPSTLLTLASVAIILALLYRKSSRLLRYTSVTIVFIQLALIVLPVGDWVLYPWENKNPPVKNLSVKPAGIIILGGALDPFLSGQNGQIALHSAAERLTILPQLLNEYPDIPVIFSGGSGYVRRQDQREADYARILFDQWKLDTKHIVFERKSRNTYENAIYSKTLMPATDGNLLLVTSADHMPRAKAVFEKQGWSVTPYAVDFNATRNPSVLCFCYSANMGKIDRMTHELIGLAAYRLAGKA